jgi:phage shock protein PspC (stress-responsive transcriptional regulator)
MALTDELERLHRLYTQGALTQAEYEAAKADAFRRFGTPSDPLREVGERARRLRLANGDRWIAGVCGGLAQLTGVESWIWRLVFVAGLMAGGASAVLYVAMWIFVPREGAAS